MHALSTYIDPGCSTPIVVLPGCEIELDDGTTEALTREHDGVCIGVADAVDDDPAKALVVIEMPGDAMGWVDAKFVRVDIGRPQGFGYALTSTYQRHGLDFTYALAIASKAGATPSTEIFVAMLHRWAACATTGADRDALDDAVAAVSRG